MSSINQGQGSVIKSIQTGYATVSTAASNVDVTVTSVNTAKAFVVHDGNIDSSAIGGLSTGYFYLHTATTVGWYVSTPVNTDNIKGSFTLVEYL